MDIDKSGFLRLLYTWLISGFIYSVAVLIDNPKTFLYYNLLLSMCVGTLIWFLGELLFGLVEKYANKKGEQLSYLVMFFIIALGSFFGTMLFNVEYFLTRLLIIGVSEISGFTMVIIYQRKYKKALNDQLKAYKSGKVSRK